MLTTEYSSSMISPDTWELKFVVWTNWVNFQKLASEHDWEVSPCEVSSGFKTELLLCHAKDSGKVLTCTKTIMKFIHWCINTDPLNLKSQSTRKMVLYFSLNILHQPYIVEPAQLG